jgi:hypothetical protein
MANVFQERVLVAAARSEKGRPMSPGELDGPKRPGRVLIRAARNAPHSIQPAQEGFVARPELTGGNPGRLQQPGVRGAEQSNGLIDGSVGCYSRIEVSDQS